MLVTSTSSYGLVNNVNHEQPCWMIEIPELLSVNYLCIDDVSDSFLEQSNNHESRNMQWNITSIFTRKYTSLLFSTFHTSSSVNIVPPNKASEWVSKALPQINLLEASYVPHKDMPLLRWMEDTLHCLF